MDISRRAFAGSLACAGMRWSGAPAGTWALLDLGPGCLLRESFLGFSRTGIPACLLPMDRQECLSYIIPAAAALPDDLARQLSKHVARGGRLIFESAAGFGAFEAQREMLAAYFGLIIGPPVDLWAAGPHIPYIDYHWPLSVKVRDFSRVVPVAAPPSEIFASIGSLPVAARRGSLIFLGSPIGPALLAGDREAHSWFRALMGS